VIKTEIKESTLGGKWAPELVSDGFLPNLGNLNVW
jgi:hypothetical protein